MSAALPDALLQDLRTAFGNEVEARLPRLRGLASGVTLDEPALEAARRDAHTLASSAWVVGEAEIAGLARAVEDAPTTGPVVALVALLEGYAPQPSPVGELS